MPIGAVKFYNKDRGYGFLKRDDGQRDIFVHINAVEADCEALEIGQRVTFEEANGTDGRLQADNVRFVDVAQ
jgi:CspA family cold shock protein